MKKIFPVAAARSSARRHAGQRGAMGVLTLVGSLLGSFPINGFAVSPTVTIALPARSAAQTCDLQYATQDVFHGVFAEIPTPAGEPSPTQRLAQLDPSYWRVNSNSDGGVVALSLPFPSAYTSADGHQVAAWDFTHQVAMLGEAPSSVPRLLSISSPPDVMFTGSGPLGPSDHPGTLQDQSYGALARYMANLVKYYNTGILATGSGPAVTYTPNTLVDSSQDFTPYGNGSYGVTVDSVAPDGQVSWQTAVITGVTSQHEVHVRAWPKGIPAGGSAFSLASSTPPITNPAPATPWPRPPNVGHIRYWEIMNEPDLSNAFFPRASPAVLAPTLKLTGVSAPGGTLRPGQTYAYRITGMNIRGVESAGGTEVEVTLAGGQNAVRLAWVPTDNMGLAPFAYRIYGRGAGAEQALVVVGRDARSGLSWSDAGTISPSGAVPNTDQGTGGFQLFRANEYRRMWDTVVPAMKAVDPSIKVVGPTLSNPSSLAHPDVNTGVVTSGPDDKSYIDQRDFVQVLTARPTNPPDVISVHAYGGSNGSADSDAALFAQPDAVTIKQYRDSVQPYVGRTPVWETETNDEAGAFARADFRGLTQLDSAWLAHNFARMCTQVPQVRTLFQFEYAIDNTFDLIAPGGPPATCPREAACKITAGRPLLAYWMVMYLNRLVPRGSELLAVGSVPAGFDVLAVAVPPDFTRVRALVVNHQVSSRAGLGAPGGLNLRLAGGTSKATLQWTIGPDTNLVTGPSPESLGSTSGFRLNLDGYSAAFVEFDTTATASPVNLTPVSATGNGRLGWIVGGLAGLLLIALGAALFARRRLRS
jgi:hypothetical protein